MSSVRGGGGGSDREAERLDPDLVVCTRLTARVEDHTPSWIEPYPDSETHSVVSVLGEHSTVEKIQLSGLLSIIDRRNGRLSPDRRGAG